MSGQMEQHAFDSSFRAGEVVIVAFPMTSGTESKARPAVALASEDWGSKDALLVLASVSSSEARVEDLGGVAIHGWAEIGLDRPSVVQAHRLFTTQQRFIQKKVGYLPPEDLELVRKEVLIFLSATPPAATN